jgi:hypothetical protein
MPTQTQVRPPLTDTVQQFGATQMAAVLALQIQTMTAAGSMLVEKDIVFADATAGAFVVTLPQSPFLGKAYAVKETSGANSVTVDAFGAGTIDGSANVTVPAGEGATFVARSIDPVTGLVTWAITSQTAPNPGAGGTLLAANNLSDVASATTSRSNLAANRKTVTVTQADLIGSSVYRYVNNSGFAQTILSIASVISAALGVGDATITASINGVPVTSGVITITQVGSAAGDVDTATPSGANVIGLGQVLELTIGGANAAASFADIAVELSY